MEDLAADEWMLLEWMIKKEDAEDVDLISLNTLRTGDADLRFYITTVQDG